MDIEKLHIYKEWFELWCKLATVDIVKAAYLTKWFGLKLKKKVLGMAGVSYPHSYISQKILSNQDANITIASAIKDNRPFMAGRYGSNELNVTWRANKKCSSWDVDVTRAMCSLQNGGGFFPNTSDAGLRFAEEMRAATAQLDLLGVWYNPMEDYAVKKWKWGGVLQHFNCAF